jgi:hypothetical protein
MPPTGCPRPAPLEEERARLRQAELDARLAAARTPVARADTVSETPDYGALLSAVRGILDSLR